MRIVRATQIPLRLRLSKRLLEFGWIRIVSKSKNAVTAIAAPISVKLGI